MDRTLGKAVADVLRRAFEERAADPAELAARKGFWRRKAKPLPAAEGALTLRVLSERTGFAPERIKLLLMGEEALMVYEADILARHLGTDIAGVVAAADAASPNRPERVFSWAEAFRGL